MTYLQLGNNYIHTIAIEKLYSILYPKMLLSVQNVRERDTYYYIIVLNSTYHALHFSYETITSTYIE